MSAIGLFERALSMDSLCMKRRRLNNQGPLQPGQNRQPVKALPTRLDSLPPEILAIILDFSLEASLIHVSRRLWRNLPAYVRYTKTLAEKALAQLQDWQDWPIPVSEPNTNITLIRQNLDPDTQRHIRKLVFSSGWFKERHLQQIHRTLLYWTIVQCCSLYGEIASSRYQRQRIKSFIGGQFGPLSSPVLHLRMSSGGRRRTCISATQLGVTISGTPFFRLLAFGVIDFGNTIPDDLLLLPFTASKAAVIRDICKPSRVVREGNKLRCDRMLLHRALLECILISDQEKFRVLLNLEERSRGADCCAVLDLTQVRQAVLHGRSSMLIYIIKQMWTNQTATVSDTDLISIMDEAKANQYPNYHRTFRILAMEVAAKWKLTEFEMTGQLAYRIPMDWPPRLIQPLAGINNSQIWFIPQDSTHDVDWEAPR